MELIFKQIRLNSLLSYKPVVWDLGAAIQLKTVEIPIVFNQHNVSIDVCLHPFLHLDAFCLFLFLQQNLHFFSNYRLFFVGKGLKSQRWNMKHKVV